MKWGLWQAMTLTEMHAGMGRMVEAHREVVLPVVFVFVLLV